MHNVCIPIHGDVAFGVAQQTLECLGVCFFGGHRGEGVAENMGSRAVKVDGQMVIGRLRFEALLQFQYCGTAFFALLTAVFAILWIRSGKKQKKA